MADGDHRSLPARRRLLAMLGLSMLTACGISGADDSAAPAGLRLNGPLAPSLTGGGAWINSKPLAMSELRGTVVLIDFWTYGCYNCQNTLPAMQEWWAANKNRNFLIIGVHTPEFAHEHDLGNLQRAVARAGIDWPVVQDNEYAIWKAYGNHYWPHFYLVDYQGRIVYDRIGEGAYDTTARQIAAALDASRT